MTAKIILNPYAGRWKGLEKRGEVEAAMRSIHMDYDLVLTEAPDHGKELAYQAVNDGFTPIISAGGDGSVSEVMNGIVLAAQAGRFTPPPLGVFPLGTANDFVFNLHLPIDLQRAAEVIAAGEIHYIDLGQVTATDLTGKITKTGYFDNNSAIGLEPTITLIQQRISWLRGPIRYLVATLIGVMRNPQWRMKIQWNNGEYEGNLTLVTAGNNPRTGGVFYLAPHANPFDGLLNIVYGYLPSRFQILRILPRTMKANEGNYIEHEAVHEINVDWLKIHTTNPTALHTDGEILFTDTRDIEYRLLPKYLPLLYEEA